MAKRKTDQDRAAEHVLRWVAKAKTRVDECAGNLIVARNELARAEAARAALGVAEVPAIEPQDEDELEGITEERIRKLGAGKEPADELATSGLPAETVARLRKRDLFNRADVREFAHGDWTRLQDLGPADDRFGPKEVAAIRKWAEGA